MAGIVATVGPATQPKSSLRYLYDNGVRILRLNCSHATHEWMESLFISAREVEREVGNKFMFLLDTRGPGIRTGDLSEPVVYMKGDTFKIVVDPELKTDEKSMYIDYPYLIKDLNKGNIIRIDSGLLDIKVIKKTKDYLIGEAGDDAVITSKRHVNLPGIEIKLPSFTDKDREDILFGLKHNIAYVALSFVRKEEDILELKEFLYKNNGAHVKVIAKIENQEGIDHISGIIRAADAIMIARGDLGAEVPVETIPSHQINIIGKTKRKGKKVIVATQMMESMIANRTPTRAEVSDIFYAVSQGADYLMLSGETSMGKYPISCVKYMNKIISEAEKYI